jgi:hypothetical protein
MSFARIRPNPSPSPAFPRWWRNLPLLAGLSTFIASSAAADFSFTIQPADPRAKSKAVLAAQEALAELVATTRKENARLRSINGLSIPAVGAVTTLAELREELNNLIEATESEIARCERDSAEYLRRADTVVADSAHLSRLMSELATEIAQTRTAIAETENTTAGEIRAATAARDEILQLQDSTNRIRQEIRNVRNRLFPRLHQAAHLGWIHPPSSYRPLPQPLPPKTERGTTVAQNGRAGNPAAIARPDSSLDRIGAVSPALALPPALAPDVQSLVDRLPALEEKARDAAARRDDAIRALERQLSEQDSQSARLSALQPERATTASQLAAARRNLTIARQTHEDYAARRSAARGMAVHAWIEWGLFQLQEKKATALLASAEGQSGQPSFLEAWRVVAAASVQLGSDPINVIATFPAQAAARGESLDPLRKDLAEGREKFRLAFVTTSTDLPATAQPYLAKGAP